MGNWGVMKGPLLESGGGGCFKPYPSYFTFRNMPLSLNPINKTNKKNLRACTHTHYIGIHTHTHTHTTRSTHTHTHNTSIHAHMHTHTHSSTCTHTHTDTHTHTHTHIGMH